jgi:hypothetical protein
MRTLRSLLGTCVRVRVPIEVAVVVAHTVGEEDQELRDQALSEGQAGTSSKEQ